MISNLVDAETALARSLGKAADRFDGELARLLGIALAALNTDRPRNRTGEITLTAGGLMYDAPADLLALSLIEWGANDATPQWDPRYAGPMPRVSAQQDDAGPVLLFRPAPTHRQIVAWGSVFRFRYRARHVLTNDESSLTPEQAALLLLRAQAQAMQELAVSGVVQPIQLHKGMGATMPSNGTPAALAAQLMDAYGRQVRGE